MRRITFFCLLLIGLLTHCVSAPRQPAPVPPAPESVPSPAPTQAKEAPLPSEPQPQPYIHEVRWPGETLSHIALWYTGSSNNWKKIARANPGLEPLSIHVGDKILIPEELLKEPAPMPRAYVNSLTTPKRPPSTRSLRPSEDTRKEELFGPVELSPSAAFEKDELYGPVELYQTPAHPGPSSTGR